MTARDQQMVFKTNKTTLLPSNRRAHHELYNTKGNLLLGKLEREVFQI